MYKEVSEKQNLLQQTSTVLKSEFVGLDQIINQMMHLVSNWFLYPQYQKRPVVINMWGMTGTGKSSLVKRLVQLLNLNEQLYHFDMGNNADSASTIKQHLRHVENQPFDSPAIFCFDEFQYANTIDNFNNEISKIYSRVVWDLIDSGRFQTGNQLSVSKSKLVTMYKNLQYLIKQGVTIQNGLVANNKDLFNKINDYKVRYRRYDHDDDDHNLFYCQNLVDDLFEILFKEYETIMQLVHHLKSLDHHQTLLLLKNVLLQLNARQTMNFSNSLIFIIGNLDEAYPFCTEMDADIDPDLLHELSLKVQLTDVKKALLQRFKPEQIARLGNNHLLYPSFSQQHYKQIIQQKLQQIAHSFNHTTSVNLTFANRFATLIYNEGVFATQGCRPLFSTIQNLVEANLPQLHVLRYHHPQIRTIHIDYGHNSLLVSGLNEHQELVNNDAQITIPVFLHSKLNNPSDDLQALIAVHEAGHATAQMHLSASLPLAVVSATGYEQMEGRTIGMPELRIVPTATHLRNNAAILLAGYVAEYLVFGKENVSAGSKSDIALATRQIAMAIKQQGMGGLPYKFIPSGNTTNLGVFETDDQNQQVQQWLNQAMATAEQVLQYQMPFLLKLATILTSKRKIHRAEIIDLQRSGYWKTPNVEGNATFSFKEKLAQYAQQTIEPQIA